MGKIITIINQKGGVGKSSLVLNIGIGIRKRNKKILLIDCDPQKNLTYTLSDGVDEDMQNNIFDVLKKKKEIKDCIIKLDNIHYIPSSSELYGIDKTLKDVFALKTAIESIKNNYDYIIVDTPPALGVITINTIIASSSIVIPTEANIYSMNGIKELNKTINSIKQDAGINVNIEGILITRFKKHTKLNKELSEVLEQSANFFNTKIFQTKISESVKIADAQANNLSVFDYCKNSKITSEYDDFINELIGVK